MELRLRGQDMEAVYTDMRDEVVINNLTREERNTLATQL